MSPSKILVTGGAGYVGSTLVRHLLAAGARVRVLDRLKFGGESLLSLLPRPRFELVPGDVRDEAAVAAALEGVDAVVHLAAIVGDPACAREPEEATAVNRDASIRLHELACAAGAARFVFASTCSNYGKMPDPDQPVDERSALRPISLYARTKVAVEEHLLGCDRDCAAQPTCLRLSTVHGLSPRMRFDLTVNEFTRDLALGRELVIFGRQFWRPYCHVADVARAVSLVLTADPATVGFEVFNVGSDGENYTKQAIVDQVLERFPGSAVRYVERDEDPRDYRVSFAKIEQHLDFRPTKTVADGIAEIAATVQQGLFLTPDGSRHRNV